MEFKKGDKVRFVNKRKRNIWTELFPPVGTIGEVTGALSPDGIVPVQWPQGSTSFDGESVEEIEDLELVEETEE